MRIIMTNQKGGVGKTTLVFHLASLFAADGKRVLAVDLDPQANLTSCYLRGELPPESNIALLYRSESPLPLIVGDHLDLVGSDPSLGSHEDHGSTDRIRAIKEWLDGLPGYDIVIFDTPPAMGLFTRSALLASDFALIPADVSWFAYKGLADLVSSIESLRARHQAEVRPLGIILNGMQERQGFAQETWAALDDRYGHLLFKNTIPESVRVREAASQGIPVTELDRRGKAAAAYRALYAEIRERLEAMP
ncbi:MAG TPA: ParA family protein [Spirochaetales bacterium]|nr:ParA family protein [Spirochaetales bacterium]HRY53375.1 ParA family protein [Spirochaetia bacterium]